jgi:altronate dehydratase
MPPGWAAKWTTTPGPATSGGGLTEIAEKSLGAVAKGGTAPLIEVYRLAQPITVRGFVYMDSPGCDRCPVTGQIASGANLIVFTAGRGAVWGDLPTPCIKIATNTEMYQPMSEDMALDCGEIVSAGVSLEAKGAEILDLMIRTASGARTKSEELGFGGAEFVPWTMGAVM